MRSQYIAGVWQFCVFARLPLQSHENNRLDLSLIQASSSRELWTLAPLVVGSSLCALLALTFNS